MARRLYNYNKDLKLLVILREPADRAFSAWTMYHHHFKTGPNSNYHDPRLFNEAILEEMDVINETNYYNNRIAYIKRGMYHYQIEAYLNYFPRDQILFLDSNDLLFKGDETIKEILSFIGVRDEPIKVEIKNRMRVDHKSDYLDDIRKMKDFYKPYNEKLYELIGKDFGWNQN